VVDNPAMDDIAKQVTEKLKRAVASLDE
jgi:hypothetical protein